jgi:hypothetical protein
MMINGGQAEQAAGKVRRDTLGRRLNAIGRPRVSAPTKVARELGVGSGTVQRVKCEMAVVPHPKSVSVAISVILSCRS